MSAETIGLLAYGLRPAPLGMTASMLTPGAYTSMSWDLQMAAAHAGCHISAFCRNPLHPGPCKGWKHHLGLVSPGALHALEKIRHEKLESNRKAKVKALQDAGHAVPKKLLTPIVYDPTKNKHILQPDKITPGLGIPTKGLTPETAKATLDAIPTKAQVGAKLDAKHAAEAAAAVPKPTQAPQYLTISKAGLKDGDKVFLHGKGKTAGEGQLVTVRKYGTAGGGKTVGGGKAQGYTFEDAHGKPIMHPHQDGVTDAPIAGGVSSKWHLSPAPGKSFPESPAQKVAANIDAAKAKGDIPEPHPGSAHKVGSAVAVSNHSTNFIVRGHNEDGTVKLENASKPGSFKDVDAGKIKPLDEEGQKYTLDTYAKKKSVLAAPSGFEKGEQTKMDNIHKLGEAQKKANGQIDTLVKMHAMVSGHHVTEKQKAAMHAKATENAQLDEPKKLVPEGVPESSAKKIAAKVYPVGSNSALMHQSDLEQALAKDIHDGLDEGKPTPVLDAAKEAGVTLGQGKPGAAQALADAVHAKLGISGHDDTPNVPNTPHGPLETTLGGKVADHGLSIADSTKLDHVKKTLTGGNDNLPAESQAYLLADLPKKVFDDHLDEHEKKAFLSRLATTHAQLDSMPNKDNHQISTMKKAEAAYEHLSGKPLTGSNHLANTGNAPAYKPSASIMQQHGENLSKVSVHSSSPLNQLDAVEHLEPEEYQALSAGDKNKVQDILHNLEGMSDKPGISNTAAALKDTLGIPHNDTGQAQADAFHAPIGSPNAGAAPHVKQAIAYANGHQSGTDTKKLAAYHKLTPAETAALDPNTKNLMEANLNGMHKKFLNPKKKAHVLNVLNKVQVAQGGGAGAGGGSTPAVNALSADHEAKAAKGAMAAYMHGYIHSAPGGEAHEALKSTLAGMHAAPNQAAVDKMFHAMGEQHAQSVLNENGYPHALGVGKAVYPHLAAEYKDAFKGGSKETPLADALSEGDTDAFINAVQDHPHLGPDALGVKTAYSDSTVDTAHALAKHAGVPEGKLSPDEFAQHYAKLSDLFGDDPADISSGHASKLGMVKGIKSIEALNLPKDVSSKLESQISDDLEHGLKADYSHAMDLGLSEPAGVAGKIDGIVKDVNKISDDLAKKNGWPDESPAKTSFKAALFSAQVKDALKANPGAGGGSTHTSPAASVVHGSPLNAVAVPDVPELPDGETHPLGGGDGIGHLSQAVKDKIGESFHGLPFGTSTSDPVESVFDNLVAVAGWHGKDAGPLSVLQAAQVVDEAKAKKYGSPNKNLTEKALLGWLGTKNGKEYAAAYATPKADQVNYLKDPEAVKKAALESQNIKLSQGQKVQTLAGGPGAYDPAKTAADFHSFGHHEAQKSQDDYMAKSGEKWTGAQKQAITTYTGSSYQEINDYLRGKGEDPTGKYQKYATQIQAGMRPLAHDQLLIRGSSYKIFPAGFNDIQGVKKLIGEDISDVGFVSTSIAGAGGEFTKALKLHIEAPVGTMGAYVRSISSHPGENEMILAAGTKFRILSVDTSGHQPIVRLRVVS